VVLDKHNGPPVEHEGPFESRREDSSFEVSIPVNPDDGSGITRPTAAMLSQSVRVVGVAIADGGIEAVGIIQNVDTCESTAVVTVDEGRYDVPSGVYGDPSWRQPMTDDDSCDAELVSENPYHGGLYVVMDFDGPKRNAVAKAKAAYADDYERNYNQMRGSIINECGNDYLIGVVHRDGLSMQRLQLDKLKESSVDIQEVIENE